MNDFVTTLLFGASATVSAVSSLLVVTRRNPIYAALNLIILFGSMAVNFWLLGAEFLGFMQLLVYAGAIMVLYIFVIMLINPRDDRLPDEGGLAERGVAAGVAVLVFGLLFTAIQGADLINIKEKLPGAVALEDTRVAALDEIPRLSRDELKETYGLSESEAEMALPIASRDGAIRVKAREAVETQYRESVGKLAIDFTQLNSEGVRRLHGTEPIVDTRTAEEIWETHGQTRAFGLSMFGKHLLVFELASVLVLIAIVGAVHMSLRPRRRRRPAAGDAEQPSSAEEQEAAHV